ncbi:MAG: neutral zinc metallopeptidase [Rhodospirillaceae bacterium]
MQWEGGRRGGGLEDRRGLGGAKIAGGGIGTIAIAAIGYLLFGIDPRVTTAVLNQTGAPEQGVTGTPSDRAGQFVDVISANINDVWAAQIEGYRPPRVVLYEQGTSTGCGYGQAAMGPFYCPVDATVYLDLGFWQEMETRLGASGAEFARAYVIAHEIGHHVQRLTGITEKVEQAQRRAAGEAEANKYSVSLELQADCYAGVWAARAAAVSKGQVALDPGDLEERLKTARAIGDDTLQSKSSGRVVPEKFTHGSSAQRMQWLRRGFESRDPAKCDTF